MRERALATIAIWCSSAVSIYLLLDRLTYVEYQFTEDTFGRTVPNPITVQAPGLQQLIIFGLIFCLICAAFGATAFIWDKAHKSAEMPEREISAKQKRDQKDRVRRLLEQMDSDDLAALESQLSEQTGRSFQ